MTGAWIPDKLGPLSGGFVYAFNLKAGPIPRTDQFFFRIADAVGTTGEGGKFSLELEEGTYSLAVQKRKGNDAPGPPRDGDLSGVVRDDKGEPLTFTVRRGKATDAGILRYAPVYKSRPFEITKETTAIAGVIKAGDGSPLAGAVALVYNNADIRTKPQFISYPTGTDGKYIVPVDQEGIYFVAARPANSSGRPQSGDTYGMYGGEEAQPVTVKKHTVVTGIDIQTGPFVDKRENRPQENKPQ